MSVRAFVARHVQAGRSGLVARNPQGHVNACQGSLSWLGWYRLQGMSWYVYTWFGFPCSLIRAQKRVHIISDTLSSSLHVDVCQCPEKQVQSS